MFDVVQTNVFIIVIFLLNHSRSSLRKDNDMNELLDEMREASNKFLAEINSPDVHSEHLNKSHCKQYLNDIKTIPIKDYDDLSKTEITNKLKKLSPLELRRLRSYELNNQRRRAVLFLITTELINKVFGK